MPCCCCRSAARRAPSRCGRSWRTSPADATSRRERLDDVAEHYLHFGGVSPINGINRALIDQIAGELAGRGMELPVYFGNRNWEPFVEDTVAPDARQRDSAGRGVRHVGVGRLLRLHPVPGGHRPGPRRGRSRRARTGQAAPVLRPSAADRDVRRRHRRRGRRPARATCAARRGWCSPPTRSRCAPASRCGPDLYERQVGYTSALVAAAAGYPRLRPGVAVAFGPAAGAMAGTRCGDHLSALAKRAPRR